jgi:hypothetical protein
MALLLFVVPKISRASSSVTSKTDTPHHQAASPVKVTDRYR